MFRWSPFVLPTVLDFHQRDHPRARHPGVGVLTHHRETAIVLGHLHPLTIANRLKI